MRRLVHDLSAVRKKPMSQGQVDKLFDAMWPGLESESLTEAVAWGRDLEKGDRRRRHHPYGFFGNEVEELLTALRASIEAAKGVEALKEASAKALESSRSSHTDDGVVLVAPTAPDRGIEVDDPEADPMRSPEGQTDAPEESSKPEG
jgi:hypothetical protein